MRVILRSALSGQLALFSLVPLILLALFYVASRLLFVCMLLGFILLVLPFNPKDDVIG